MIDVCLSVGLTSGSLSCLPTILRNSFEYTQIHIGTPITDDLCLAIKKVNTGGVTYPFDFVALLQSFSPFTQPLVSNSTFSLEPHTLHFIQILHGGNPFLKKRKNMTSFTNKTRGARSGCAQLDLTRYFTK